MPARPRSRKVSQALRVYALFASSADKGAARVLPGGLPRVGGWEICFITMGCGSALTWWKGLGLPAERPVIERLTRRSFRDAYDYRCAMSGLRCAMAGR